jgi:hypothetical protein
MITRDVDYGWWDLPNGQRARVSWNVDTGVLYVHWPERGDEPLIVCNDRAAVDRLLADRHELQYQPSGLTNLRLRIAQTRKDRT